MPKNIILLSDGTGNSASKLFKTNVWRLYQALDVAEPGAAKPGEMPKSAAGERAQPMQVAYYDDGVGTAAFTPLAILGGAFGWGLKRNVLDLYTFLCRHYEEGDSIYCFGFSRGAFTIRVLTGLVANQGLVSNLKEGKLRRLAADAFRAYRENRYPGSFLTKIFRGLRAGLLWVWYKITRRTKYNPKLNRPAPKIKFLGLWDTVAAYGLPVDELTHAWNYVFPLSFPDRNLSDRIERACHALALDDERLSFHPELWNENEEDYRRKRAQLQGAEAKPARHIQERLTQIWFAGMHTNVGGGYPDDGMAHVSLDWIMTEAEASELRFKQEDREQLKAAADINGKMYDSRGGVGCAYRYL
ncbi:MAG: DUF2235 domain-containing protein, partial [Acidobacteriota bacterium]|nr:DUF2235 domain-containing protein [Acidobacteriota bacterium]